MRNSARAAARRRPKRGEGEAKAEAPLGPLGYCRENPVEAVFLSRTRLNEPGGEKETWHVEIDLTGTPIEYVVGDSLGLFPSNPPALVDAIIAELGTRPERMIGGQTLRNRLIKDYSLGAAPDGLYQLLSLLTSGEARKKARALSAGEDPDGDAAYLDVLGALHKFPGARPDAEVFLEALDELQPRLYSISSSPKADPGRVSLTVDAVRYNHRSRLRLGVASTHLGERIAEKTTVKVYLQKAHGFALPEDLSKDVIMCGPGTGIATVPRLPARARRDPGAGPQLAVLRPPAPSQRLLLQGRAERAEGRQGAHPPVPRLVAGRHREDLCAGSHARERCGPVEMARRRRPFLCLRRCQAHGQGCGASDHRRRRVSSAARIPTRPWPTSPI